MDLEKIVKKVGGAALDIAFEAGRHGAKNILAMTDDELIKKYNVTETDPVKLRRILDGYRMDAKAVQEAHNARAEEKKRIAAANSDDKAEPQSKDEGSTIADILNRYNNDIAGENKEIAKEFCKLLGNVIYGKPFMPIRLSEGSKVDGLLTDYGFAKTKLANAYHFIVSKGHSSIKGEIVWLLRSMGGDAGCMTEGVVLTTKGIYLLAFSTSNETRFIPYSDIKHAYTKKGFLNGILKIELNNGGTVDYKYCPEDKCATVLNHIVRSVIPNL